MIAVDESAVDQAGISESNLNVPDQPGSSRATEIHHFASVPQNSNPSVLSDDSEMDGRTGFAENKVLRGINHIAKFLRQKVLTEFYNDNL